MNVPRIYVDFNELIEDNLVHLSKDDFIKDSKGNIIELKEGLEVKIYSDDLGGCNEEDNLIADGIVEINRKGDWVNETKWNCRINNAGIYNESQRKL